jgi:hypothetical protein
LSCTEAPEGALVMRNLSAGVDPGINGQSIPAQSDQRTVRV